MERILRLAESVEWEFSQRKKKQSKYIDEKVVELPEDIVIARDIVDSISIAMWKRVAEQILPPQEFLIWKLLAMKDYTPQEIAKILSLKESSVRKALSRARKKLKFLNKP